VYTGAPELAQRGDKITSFLEILSQAYIVRRSRNMSYIEFTMRSPLSPPLVLLSSSLLLASCSSEEPGPGSLEVRYVLGPDRTCEELGIEELELTLEDTQHAVVVPCDDASERVLRLDNLAPRRYIHTIRGLDGAGIATMDNLGESRDRRRVEVLGDGAIVEADETSELTVTPVYLQVSIDFAASSCASAGMSHLEISAYDQTADILLDAAVPCDDNTEGFFEVEDELRALKGSLFSEMTIQAISRKGEPMGPVLNPGQFEPVGPGRTVWLELLNCTSDGCPETQLDLPVAD
jgi:hypothetical protein